MATTDFITAADDGTGAFLTKAECVAKGWAVAGTYANTDFVMIADVNKSPSCYIYVRGNYSGKYITSAYAVASLAVKSTLTVKGQYENGFQQTFTIIVNGTSSGAQSAPSNQTTVFCVGVSPTVDSTYDYVVSR